MTSATVELLLADVADFQQAGIDRALHSSLLSPEELERSDRFHRPQDRMSYRCAHLALRLIAARWLDVDPDAAGQLRFTRTCRSCGGAHGKPTIPGTELSMSRSDAAVMVAASPSGQPIGADIESIPRSVLPGFDRCALSPSEISRLSPGDTRSRIEHWVAKEAAVKLTGEGLSADVTALTVRPVRTGAGSVSRWSAEISAPGLRELDRLRIAPFEHGAQHAAALSSRGAPRIEALTLQDLLAGVSHPAPRSQPPPSSGWRSSPSVWSVSSRRS